MWRSYWPGFGGLLAIVFGVPVERVQRRRHAVLTGVIGFAPARSSPVLDGRAELKNIAAGGLARDFSRTAREVAVRAALRAPRARNAGEGVFVQSRRAGRSSQHAAADLSRRPWHEERLRAYPLGRRRRPKQAASRTAVKPNAICCFPRVAERARARPDTYSEPLRADFCHRSFAPIHPPTAAPEAAKRRPHLGRGLPNRAAEAWRGRAPRRQPRNLRRTSTFSENGPRAT